MSMKKGNSTLHKSRKFGFTLAEVFCPLRKSKRAAFTLAEVLITLGVIGVVAAITMPSLIQNHQKKEIVTRLKQTYSIISQAMTMAQAANGEMMYWGADDMNGEIYYNAETGETFEGSTGDFINNFTDTYFKPYIKYVKDYGIMNSFSVYGEGNRVSFSDGSEGGYGYGRYIALTNGALVNIFVGSSGCQAELDENGKCTEDQTFTGIFFKVDVNGLKKPNIHGKDIFIVKLDASNNKVVMQNYAETRAKTRAICSTNDGSQVCGALIQMDGWQFAPDYPYW